VASFTLLDHLRNYLIAQALVRAPDVPGAGPRPWLPPAWRHPDGGAVGPGDAKDAGKPAAAQDDGLVVSLIFAPGIPPAAGEEERRIDGVDIQLRGRAVPAIVDLESAIRHALLGNPPDPGGRTDWVMDGLYVVQVRLYRALQPIAAAEGVYTFVVGYLFETRA
jgi:hypothetical protein